MIVFDAGAFIALLRLERGALIVRQLLRANPGGCHLHAVNLFEIYYGFERAKDAAYAERSVRFLQSPGSPCARTWTLLSGRTRHTSKPRTAFPSLMPLPSQWRGAWAVRSSRQTTTSWTQ